jgi:predicted nucleotide-binding protein
MAPVKAAYRPRIYIHAPYTPGPKQAILKKAILKKIQSLGFEPQEFHISGLPRGDTWNFDRAIEVMRQCDGALILALKRWQGTSGRTVVPIPSEYSHFEGALAVSRGLPTIVVAEEGMQPRGILAHLGKAFVVRLPTKNTTVWLASDQFLKAPPFKKWVADVRSRYDVFFGYCSEANKLARGIKDFLINKCGMRVMDWATEFRPGRTIMDEIARASATCRCGLFLFTKSDQIVGTASKTSVPRDNVLLEAGYFISAHSAKRVVVVRENGTKMPADLGGIIYLTIKNRNSWLGTAQSVANALHKQMREDTGS